MTNTITNITQTLAEQLPMITEDQADRLRREAELKREKERPAMPPEDQPPVPAPAVSAPAVTETPRKTATGGSETLYGTKEQGEQEAFKCGPPETFLELINPIHSIKHLFYCDDLRSSVLSLLIQVCTIAGVGEIAYLYIKKMRTAIPVDESRLRIILPEDEATLASPKAKNLPKELQAVVDAVKKDKTLAEPVNVPDDASVSDRIAMARRLVDRSLGDPGFNSASQEDLGRTSYNAGLKCYDAGFYNDAQLLFSASQKYFYRARILRINEHVDNAMVFASCFGENIAKARLMWQKATLEVIRPVTPYVDAYFEMELGVANPAERKSMVESALDAVAWAYQDDGFAKGNANIRPAEPVEIWLLITDAAMTARDIVYKNDAVRFAELDAVMAANVGRATKQGLEALIERATQVGSAEFYERAIVAAEAMKDEAAVGRVRASYAEALLGSAKRRPRNETFVRAVIEAKKSGNRDIYKKAAAAFLSRIDESVSKRETAEAAVRLFAEIGDDRMLVEALLANGRLAKDEKSYNTALERAATMEAGPERDEILAKVIDERYQFEKGIGDVRDELDFINFEAELFEELGEFGRRNYALIRRAFVEKNKLSLDPDQRWVAYSTLRMMLMDAKKRGDKKEFNNVLDAFLWFDAGQPIAEYAWNRGAVADVLNDIGEHELALKLYVEAGVGFRIGGHPELARHAFRQAIDLVDRFGVGAEMRRDLEADIRGLSKLRAAFPYRESGVPGIQGRRAVRAVGANGEGQPRAVGAKGPEGPEGEAGRDGKTGKEKPGK